VAQLDPHPRIAPVRDRVTVIPIVRGHAALGMAAHVTVLSRFATASAAIVQKRSVRWR
jgi:hypothetical protein